MRRGPPNPPPPAPERPRNANHELDVRLVALELKRGDVLLVEIDGSQHEIERAQHTLKAAMHAAGHDDVPVVVSASRLGVKLSVVRPTLGDEAEP